MSCNRQQFPAAICSFVEDVTGETISQSDWHGLVQRAKERGYETGRGRLDKFDFARGLEALGNTEGQPDKANAAIERAGFDRFGGWNFTAVNTKPPTYTKNMAAVTRMLADDGVAASLADVRGETLEPRTAATEGQNDLPGSGSLSDVDSVPAARSVGSKYTGYRHAKEISKDVRNDVKELRRQGVIPEDVKVSVRSENFTGGQAVDVTLSGWERERILREDGLQGLEYTDEAKAIMDAVEVARESYNRDNSDTMTDYFDVTYYGSTNWDFYNR